MTNMTAATMIRQARREAGLSQEGLGHRAGVPQSTVARLERPGANPTFDLLARVLRAAGATLDLRRLPPVDESQIVERLRLTPAERLATFQASHRNLQQLTSRARRRPS
jgi:transcriptional regulator with XRE-family HTH domain